MLYMYLCVFSVYYCTVRHLPRYVSHYCIHAIGQ